MAAPSIQVYQLVPAGTLFSLKDQLQNAIFGKDIFIDQKDRVFTVSQSCGWLGYSDYTALWRQLDPTSLPQSTDDVLRAAEQFLDGVNSRTQAFNQVTGAGLRSLLPDKNQRRFENCSLVMKPDKSSFDHWICRYSMQATAGTATAQSIPIFGMSLELRIGKKGAVIGFNVQWRPTLRTTYADLYPYEQFAFLLQDPDNPDNTDNPYAGQMLYVYDGAMGNQYYLAPYYFAASDDHVRLSPASKLSLVLKILTKDSSDGTQLTGIAYGGSGAYSFNWAYWNMDTAWASDGGQVILGEGDVSRQRDENGSSLQSVLMLPPSYYTVMLNVTDQRTGAYRHLQQNVYSSPNPAPYGNV